MSDTRQDDYAGICDWWPKVTEWGTVQIYLDNERGNFVAKLEEEHFVSSDTLEGVKAKIDRAQSFKERAKTQKLDPIPVTRVEFDKWDATKPAMFEDCEVVALHAGNGNAIIKTEKGKKEQVSWDYNKFYPRMTPETREKYAALYKAHKDAERAFTDFDRSIVIHKLKEHARKVWKMTPGE